MITINALGAEVNLQLRAGDRFRFTGLAKDGSGAPLSLTGKTVECTCWRRAAVTDSVAIPVTITNAPSGEYAVDFTSAITSGFIADDFFRAKALYAYKVSIIDASGPLTLLYGTVDTAKAEL